MRNLRVERVPHDPTAVILTAQGWQFPDGTFKPHYVRAAPIVQERPSVWARLFRR